MHCVGSPVPASSGQRFLIRGRLGAGTFGDVFRAFDREREEWLALKILRATNPGALYRFKREFRLRARIEHDNLVDLYELFCETDAWFFTMELVRGVELLRYLDAAPAASRQAATRTVFRQLARAVRVLHAAGTLHRDIKPGNVLVSQDGRVVLLDFGFITELTSQFGETSCDLAGTPAYMSPEQAAGEPLAEGSDWYAFGVVLFEAITGRLPFAGTSFQQMRAKWDGEVPDATGCAGAGDLAELATALLRRRPEDRPSADEILAVLDEPKVATRLPAVGPPRAADFVGRRRELDRLRACFESARRDGAVLASIHGSAGIGKTRLALEFLGSLRRSEPDMLVLAGRCYENESVSYKAVDAVVDALAQFLRKLPSSRAEALLSRDNEALARLFPVFRTWAPASTMGHQAINPHEQRRRGFAALREVVGRLAAQRPVVLFIDDVQWGDVDSAAILFEWLRRPDAPAALILLAHRDADLRHPPLLRALTAALGQTDEPPPREDVPLGPLDAAAAQAMAGSLLARTSSTANGLAASIAREAGGNPFFIDELAEREYTLAPADKILPPRHAPSLERLIRERVQSTGKSEQRLLETIAVAGRPIERRIAVTAAGMRGSCASAFAALHRANLAVPATNHDGCDTVEPYHDRIRETVVAMLGDDELRECHRRLASTLEREGSGDSESLALHWSSAGEHERAACHAARAADCAAEALAFDHAAALYRLAIDLGRETTPPSSLHLKLGTALAHAGRCEDAARVFLTAAEAAEGDDALELVRRGAEQLLYGGYAAEGRRTIQQLLGKLGIALPANPRRALPGLLFRRLKIFARGYDFAPRPRSEIDTRDLLRLDSFLTATRGLAWLNPVLGTALNAQSLLLALDVGEPLRVARALAGELGYLGFFRGAGDERRFDDVYARLVAMSEELGEPKIRGDAEVHAGLSRFNWGRWREALAFSDGAERILREECQGVSWELVNAELCQLNCLLYLGELDELAKRYRIFFERAAERRDQHAQTYLRLRVGWYVALVHDDPFEARRRLTPGARSQDDHLGLFMSAVGTAELAIYEGRPDEAIAHFEHHWDALDRRSTLLRVPILMVEILFARARANIATAEMAGDPRCLRAAAADACRMRRTAIPWAVAAATSLDAGIASQCGHELRSRALLVEAESRFVAADCPMHAEAVRLRRSLRESSRHGSDRADTAHAALVARGVVDPMRFSRYLVPGLGEERLQ